jgi:hypothetical protein
MILSVVVSEDIFASFEFFQRDSTLGNDSIDSVRVHATARRVGFIASLDTRTSRALFIL